MLSQEILPRFGTNFLEDHARLIISNPSIALVELVANCWDAGADKVDITWPKEARPDSIVIRDNGGGMTFNEFTKRWPELNYNRLQDQGEDVSFPKRNQKGKRKAFGRNGKGRHSMFCFSNEYTVKTWKEGQGNEFLVQRTSSISGVPFAIRHIGQFNTDKDESGTVIAAELVKSHLEPSEVRDLIGSKFVADPTFKIYFNNEPVELTDLSHLSETRIISIPSIGSITVQVFDSHKKGRTSKHHGVAWWVNKRLVGEPSWRDYADLLLDGRTAEAKRYTFIVEADVLANDVLEDWSDFFNTERVRIVRNEVRKKVLELLHDLMKDVHKAKKITALRTNRQHLSRLPLSSQNHIGRFVDDLQGRLPAIDQRELNATVSVLSKLEEARSGYTLLEQLAKLDSDDLDMLSEILAKWSVREATIVLDELHFRLEIIQRMEKLLDDPSSDELHDIQPLFEQGLWIFGPEYESVSFIGNRTLKTVVEVFLKDKLKRPFTNPKKRPDIVALADASIGVYTSDAFDDDAEVDGIAKVLIVELKRGGFEITPDERFQAQRYAGELRKTSRVQQSTQIVTFVLGTTIAEDARSDIKEGENTIVCPRTYSTILRRAHARTFKLLEQIRRMKQIETADIEVETVLNNLEQASLLPTDND